MVDTVAKHVHTAGMYILRQVNMELMGALSYSFVRPSGCGKGIHSCHVRYIISVVNVTWNVGKIGFDSCNNIVK